MTGSAQKTQRNAAASGRPHQPTSDAPVFNGVLEMVGNTPMLRVTKIDTGDC